MGTLFPIFFFCVAWEAFSLCRVVFTLCPWPLFRGTRSVLFQREWVSQDHQRSKWSFGRNSWSGKKVFPLQVLVKDCFQPQGVPCTHCHAQNTRGDYYRYILANLCPGWIVVVIDYKIKVELGLRAHENQWEWYGKRGISPHGFLVIAQVSYFLDSVVAYVCVILIHHFLFLDFAVKSNLSLCTS